MRNGGLWLSQEGLERLEIHQDLSGYADLTACVEKAVRAIPKAANYLAFR